MPRDGAGVYVHPFPDVVEGTTIESAVFNGNTADVEQDLNMPRPIIAGGTGASDATSARTNLQAEVATQVVTNYDSHVFEAGSFRSDAAATGGPVAGGGYVGTCLIYNNPTVIVLEAFALNDSSTPPTRWMRVKSTTWTAWVNTTASDDARYVNVTGDAMTGALAISGPNSTSSVTGALVVTGGVGISSDMFIAGTIKANFFTSSVGGSATDGYYFFGTPGAAKNINFLAANGVYRLEGGGLTIAAGNVALSNGNVAVVNSSLCSLALNSGTDDVRMLLQGSGSTRWNIFSSLTQFAIANAGATGGVQLAGQAATSWSAYSDARLKDDVETLNVLDALQDFRAVRYTYRPSGATEIGIIAQEQVGQFPELIKVGSEGELTLRENDPKQVAQDTWSAAYDRFGVIALQGVKELLARIEALEAEVATLRRK